MTTILATEVTAGRHCRELLERFRDRIDVNPDLDRRLVSFQGNRDAPFYGWLKYKEGFSAGLVAYFLARLSTRKGVLLDPFAGAGSALFAARDLGWSTIGIELLPVGAEAIRARLAADTVAFDALYRVVTEACKVDFAEHYDPRHCLNHVPITRGAFPPSNERALVGYLAYCQARVRLPALRALMRFAAMSVLEEISYTRKDGQYLRWDRRSRRGHGTSTFDKGRIATFNEAIRLKLSRILRDVRSRDLLTSRGTGELDLRVGSCLDLLPRLEPQSVDFVVTSPPYCNRYDYTRTYALELVLLGATRGDFRKLRQRMLSCTVENVEKVAELRIAYEQRGSLGAYDRVVAAFDRQRALAEVLDFLEQRRLADELNNQNIVRMVRNYFFEMAFVICELARVMRSGGKIVMVNDNVRYAGREVPVDLVLCDFAESFGLRARKTWVLPRGKGNSSQQMGAHGRTELRKCVYIWEKP